ncbi:hypothetical protein N9N28_09730 [Rubripirellula amarantea]|uniref:Uncharacterized protein n=1 Tax=Rubripirellula amarantea TaxID=2527999 RepID=A0A5C5WVJ0_9BACT|nr:hypothetical protein [Rubripirellula amarantea]MDA8744898.1 hypothetical protein [Rubripirellula amarantea]TWT54727.1 hypothetical protein Pla22_23790 [Rubripirellula amarantea]
MLRSIPLLMLLTSCFVVAAMSPAFADPATAEKSETVSVFGEVTMQIPADFKRVKPQSMILEHEFQASEGEGDDAKVARVTMMASGGGVQPNIARWKGQFTGGDDAAKKVEVMDAGQWKIHVVDTNGNFSERMGGGPFAGGKVVNRKDYGMTGAILESPTGKLFFVKMIGPQSTVKANRDAFLKMVKSIEKSE